MIIYKSTNLIPGKCYIGQAVDFEKRKYRHLWDAKNNNDNSYFHNALRKYGENNFKWEILCECGSKEELDKMEKHYIKLYNTKWPNGYNLTDGGEGNLGRIVKDETKKKMSIKMKGKNNPMYNKHHTDETKKKISENCKGRKLNDETKKKMSYNKKGKKHNDETKRKIGEKNKKSSSKYYKIIYPNGDIKIINGLKQWCNKIDLIYSTIQNYIDTDKCYKGYKITRILLAERSL